MKYLVAFISLALLWSCEKEIDIDLPESERRLVVEGSIEPGEPPFVILSKTIGYFAPTDVNTFQSLFVHDAVITVSNGTNTVQLSEICTSQLPDSVLASLAVLIGANEEDLKNFDYCIYSTLDPSIFGEVGKTYSLTIVAEGQRLTSSTTIPQPLPMNYYFYKDQPGYSNYGYLWFNQTDPPAYGNAYRIFTQRAGKDGRFLPADGSVWDDQLINGLTFDAFVWRGAEPNSTAAEDNNETSEYFLQGDTVYIKFCTIDMPHYDFWNTYETAQFSSGNPFSAPTTIRTNIEGGGLGVWGGYGVTYDTIVLAD